MVDSIHGVSPTQFKTRHDISMTWEGLRLWLAWTDMDNEVWVAGVDEAAAKQRRGEQIVFDRPHWVASGAVTGPSVVPGIGGFTKTGVIVAFANADQRIVVRTVLAAEGYEAVLGETTRHRPSLSWQRGLWLAWTGGGGALNTIRARQALDFEDKVTYGEASYCSPALGNDVSHLVLAWNGTDKRRSMNVASIDEHSGELYGRLTLEEVAGGDTGPGLGAEGSVFVLAWGAPAPFPICTVQPWEGSRTFVENGQQKTRLAPAIEPPLLAWVDLDNVIQIGGV